LSILCISQSDIIHFHWVPHKLSGSQKASRAESNYWSNFMTSCCPSGIKDRIKIHIMCINCWQAMVLLLDRSDHEMR
jgi:hypothetical protein